MRKRFNERLIGERNKNCPRAGNYKLHDKRCMCCERIVDGKHNLQKLTKTKSELKMKLHYTCQ